MTRRLAVNRAFAAQRITGQQRYAVELSTRLLTTDDVRPIDPPSRTSASALRTWAWAQGPALRTARDEYLLSLTSRAPFAHPRHILTVHDLFVLEHPEWFSRAYVATHAPMLSMQLRTARAVLAVSRPTADAVRSRLPDRVPVVLAPNGVGPAFFQRSSPAASAEVLARRGLTRGSYFVCVGSLDPRKNLVRLAEAYGSLSAGMRSDHPLVIVGGSSESFRAVSIPWPTGVVITGYVPEDELRVLYHGARAAIVPSLAEGFGLPVVEAAAAEVPLILSDIEAFRWVYGDGARYVDPASVGELADAIADAVASDSRDDTALAARAEELRLRFDWQHSADAVRTLLAELP